MADYRRVQKVMFQHCDPAGIVFYPRYFEMINATVEDWFEEVVGLSFAAMHGPADVGVPAARISVDFRAPSRLGEVLEFRLAVARLGGASCDLAIRALGPDGRERIAGSLTIVHVNRTSLRPQPWPEALRARMLTTTTE